jgi:hypothetical protein
MLAEKGARVGGIASGCPWLSFYFQAMDIALRGIGA